MSGSPMRVATGRGLGLLVILAAFASPSVGAGPARADAGFPLACFYVRSELDRFEGCARADGDAVRLAPRHLARMRFRRGLAEVRIPGIGTLWARPDGLAMPVFTLDNGSDPFAQGLVRGFRGGKVAFYDRRLRPVLVTDYDWSFPFDARGRALACRGCRSDEKEPSSMVGGSWALIDRRGRVVRSLTGRDEPSKRSR